MKKLKKQDLTELLVRPTKKRAIKIEQNLTGVNRVESSEKLNVFQSTEIQITTELRWLDGQSEQKKNLERKMTVDPAITTVAVVHRTMQID